MRFHSGQGKEAAIAASPYSLSSAPPRPRNRRQTVLLVTALLGLLGASARLLWLSPAVQQRRLTRLPLATLAREAQQRPDDAYVLSLLGQRLNQQGRYSEAEAPLRRAVGLDPTNWRSRDEWARAQLGIGQITEAFGQLRQFAGTNPNSAPAHFILGKFYFTQKSMQHAREELERAIALDPTQGSAWAYLSQATDQLGEANRSLEAAQQAVQLRPEDAGYHLLLAGLLERAHRQSEAGAEYAHAVIGAPRNSLMHQQYARWLTSQKPEPAGRAQAEAEIRKALALAPNEGASQLLLGRILKDSGHSQEATTPLLQAASLLPDDPTPVRALAEVYRELGQTKQATTWQQTYLQRQTYLAKRDALYQQLRVHPEAVELHRRMGDLLGTHGDVDGTIRNYAAALHRAPDSPLTLGAASRALLKGGYAAQALPLAQRAVTLSMHSPDTHEALGDALLQFGRIDEAIANYNFTTTYVPARASTLQERVNRYAATHRVVLPPAETAYRTAQELMHSQIGLRRVPLRAEEMAQKAVTLEPTNVEYLRFLLRLQFQRKKAQEAIGTARQLLRIMPKDTQTHALLAVLLADQAKSPAEQAEAEAHLVAAGNAPEVAAQQHYARGLLALQRHDPRQALSELQEAARIDPEADVTYYKIAMAEHQLGQPNAAAHTMTAYQERQRLKREEFTLQSNVSQQPNRKEPYLALARFYQRSGRKVEADQVAVVLRQRFGTADTPSRPQHSY